MSGPERATLRRAESLAITVNAAVMGGLISFYACECVRDLRRRASMVSERRSVLTSVAAAAQGLGATDDLHDLGGDRLLAGAVHDAGQAS